ncbi:hypothetical protein DMC18_23410, partial [Caulobacter sp. D5]|uniref:hypothetical protein n=1 Tax=Caulobacter sp. D5 TaxID=357400 RepID=UPI000D97EB03
MTGLAALLAQSPEAQALEALDLAVAAFEDAAAPRLAWRTATFARLTAGLVPGQAPVGGLLAA